jgi:serine/threonine protein kinase/Flp pilus assembly protein TadD
MGDLAGNAQTAAQWIPAGHANVRPPDPAIDDDAVTGVLPPLDPDATRVPGMASGDAGETLLPPPPDSDATRYAPPPPTQRPATGARPSGTGRSASAVGRTLSGGAEGPLKSGQAFGARYHIIKVLGVGGMGAVYQAWDAELGVSVAVKVIRPEITADPDAAMDIERRFKRELLLARQVTHKNVVRIHDLGEIDGIKYITMAFINGADLATLLKKEQKLPVPRALHIARGIVAGLVTAHQEGVVHRDLKPANIMVGDEDEPTIMDFGIARTSGRPSKGAEVAVNVATTELRRAAAQLGGETMAGAIVGTVEYMAPEQAKGQEVDQRADVYAFGLILYDMLIGGRRSERAASAIAELQGRIEHAPPTPRSVDATIPVAVDEIITRCLEPDAAKRFQTTRELQEALDKLDENGKPLPIIRRLTKRGMAGAAVLVLALVAGTFYGAQWLFAPPKEHDPVLVVIADLQNDTNDPTFNHTLEPMLKRALESAGFISAYDRTEIRRAFSIDPPDTWDEAAARELAIKQGVGVVLAGAIAPQGNGYQLSLRASETVSGREIATTQQRASGKDQVLDVATQLVATIRTALGDETSESAQLFAMKSLSTASLDVVAHYAAAVEAQSRGRTEEALQSYQNAVKLDPNFGLGYQGLSAMSRNLGRLEDAEKYAKAAISHLDGMTERERFAVRGLYYAQTSDYEQCVKEYGELVAQFPVDAVAHSNRAFCFSKLRRMGEAVEELRQAVSILPRRVLFRGNLAVYSAYAGDFAGAEEAARSLEQPTDLTTVALAFAQLAQGQLAEAAKTYEQLGALSARGRSWALSGLADLAVYEGRFSDAVRSLEEAVAADIERKNNDRAARKLTSLAQIQLLRGQREPALAAAEKALEISKAVPIRFLAARVLVEGNQIARAQTLADGLANEITPEPRAYAKIISGEIALKKGNAGQAVTILNEANTIMDTWLGHLVLGRAYLEADSLLRADSELDLCIKRRGEALAILLDEEATYGLLPMVHYYQGRVREGLKTAGFAESYREYLKIRGNSTEDPLLSEVRRRAGN